MADQIIKHDSSLQYVALKTHTGEASIEDIMFWMSRKGSSVSLNWGEDTEAWECSWITSGDRFTGVHGTMRLAILGSLNKCFAKAAETNPLGA